MVGRLWHLFQQALQNLARYRWQLAGLAALVTVLACVLVIPQWLVGWELGASTRTLTAAERAKAINDVRATLLQGLGGTVLLLGVYFTYRQLQTAVRVRLPSGSPAPSTSSAMQDWTCGWAASTHWNASPTTPLTTEPPSPKC